MGNDNRLIVEYGKTKNHYVILSEDVLMKDPNTREWITCVLYRQHKEYNHRGEYVPVPEDEKLTFVREYKDFWSKFTLCLDL